VGWINPLRGALVGLDTAPLIYYIEEHPTYLAIVEPFFQAVDRGELEIVTSTITLIEVLVQPIRRGDIRLAQRYRGLLRNTRGLRSLPVSDEIAEVAAQLRATYNVRIADAIQLATAMHSGATFFLTNDGRLPSIPNLEIRVLGDLRQGNEA
jgi:predicted nucleic acid-binding protein